MSLLSRFFSNLATKYYFLIIIFIGLVIFSNGLFNGFVRDDGIQIVNNPTVQSIKNIGQFFSGSTFYNGAEQKLNGYYYKPIQSTVFASIYSIFGSNYFAFHLFQITLHIVNGCLLFLIFTHFFKKVIAFGSTLIFLVHPIISEAVFYVSATQEVLFFVFGILSLWLTAQSKSKKILIIIPVLLLSSLLSKETGILYLILLNAYVLLYKRKWLYLIAGLSSLVFLTYFVLRIHAVGIYAELINAPVNRLGLLDRVINIPDIIFVYLKTFFFPINLSSSYNWVHTQIGFWSVLFPLVIDLLFFGACVYFGFFLYKKRSQDLFKMYIFFSIWFLLGLFLHLQLLPLDATVADRWFYFPIVGLIGMLGVFVSTFRMFSSRWFLLAFIIIFLTLSVRTFMRSFDWRDESVLSFHDSKVSKNDYVLENIMGVDFLKKGMMKEAKYHIDKSIAAFPYYNNYTALGLIYLNQGEYEKAKAAFLKTREFGDYYLAYEDLGGLTLVMGDKEENLNFLKEAVIKFPQNGKLWLYLAILEYQSGNLKGAKEAISKAYIYGDSREVANFYNKIMNNQPLDLDIQVSH